MNKLCTKCNIEKNISLFHKCKRLKDGYKNICKECKKEENRIYRNNIDEHKRIELNRKKREKRKLDRIKGIESGEIKVLFNDGKRKQCSRCDKIKYYDEYSEKYNKKISHCKECEKIRYNEWYSENKQKVFNYQRKYAKDNPEKAKLWAKNSRDNADKKQVLKNGKEWRDKNKERMAELKREWRKKNPEKDAEYNHKRRDRLNEISLSSKDIKEIKERYNNICYWCNKKIKSTPHLDHYEPISKGGANTIDNIVLSCRKCNQSKGSKTPTEFAISIGKLL